MANPGGHNRGMSDTPTEQGLTKPMLLLVDGSSYLYRAFHAMPDLRAVPGDPTSPATGAIRGMINMMQKLRKDVRADYAVCVFDAPGKTFRDDLYPQYKANRSPMPDDLRAQIPPIHEVVRLLGWKVLDVPGVEADDVIATLSCLATAQGVNTVISSGDKDLSQLVNANVMVIDTMNDRKRDVAGVLAEFGVLPERMVDYQTLVGDTVDNVPGVNKVGPKTAVKLLTEYGSLDALVARATEVKGAVGEHLRAALEWIPTGRALVTMRTDCDLHDYIPGLPAFDDIALGEQDAEKLREFYERYGFKSLARQVMAGEAAGAATEARGRGRGAAAAAARRQAGQAPSREAVALPPSPPAVRRLHTMVTTRMDTTTPRETRAGILKTSIRHILVPMNTRITASP